MLKNKVKILDVYRPNTNVEKVEEELEMLLDEGYKIVGQSANDGFMTYTLVLKTKVRKEFPDHLRKEFPDNDLAYAIGMLFRQASSQTGLKK